VPKQAEIAAIALAGDIDTVECHRVRGEQRGG